MKLASLWLVTSYIALTHPARLGSLIAGLQHIDELVGAYGVMSARFDEWAQGADADIKNRHSGARRAARQSGRWGRAANKTRIANRAMVTQAVFHGVNAQHDDTGLAFARAIRQSAKSVSDAITMLVNDAHLVPEQFVGDVAGHANTDLHARVVYCAVRLRLDGVGVLPLSPNARAGLVRSCVHGQMEIGIEPRSSIVGPIISIDELVAAIRPVPLFQPEASSLGPASGHTQPVPVNSLT